MLVAAAAALLTLPAAGSSGPGGGQSGYVPKELLDAATARPYSMFNVIVQGSSWMTSRNVSDNVRNEEDNYPGNEDGVSHRFRSIRAVAAQLTGRQIVRLSRDGDIVAITSDVPLGASLDLPPSNLGLPSIAGTAEVGSTLAAAPGEWAAVGQVGYAYQWLRCDAVGTACAEIGGETGSSYPLTAADAGSTVAVRVAATDAGGTGSAVSSPSSVVAPPVVVPLVPPSVLALPSVSGDLVEGSTLAASDGLWSSAGPLALSRRWERCSAAGDGCTDVAGATADSYVLGPSDVGATMRVVVTAAGDEGTAFAESPVTTVVAPAPVVVPLVPPSVLALPSVSGDPVEGSTLAAFDGLWSSAGPLSLSHRWQRCTAAGDGCVDVGTAESYLLGAADVGATLRVVVTASGADGSASAESAVTVVVAAAPVLPPAPVVPPSNLASPLVSGDPVEGSALTATDGLWAGGGLLALSRGWQRCSAAGDGCVDVAGATGESYVLGAGDVGATLRVVVTAMSDQGSAVAKSAATAVVAGAPVLPPAPLPPANVGLPTVAGAAEVGSTLTAGPGAWTGTGAPAFAYQWLRCDQAGAACSQIAGATAESYALTVDDAGSTVAVSVAATDAGGTASAVSAPTSVVAAPAVVVLQAPLLLEAPVVAGEAVAGNTLSASTGIWNSATPPAYTYAWQRCSAAGDGCLDVAGSTSASYLLGADDVGATVRVAVTAANADGVASATSTATGAVTPPPALPPRNVAAPAVSGTLELGSTLTAAAGEWAGDQPIVPAYRWQRCGATCGDIAGAGAATYVVTADDIGLTLRAVVTATNGAGSVESPSAPTAVVRSAAPVLLDAPVVDGAAVSGATLTASTGTWTSATTPAYTYAWQRCTLAGCAAVQDATSATYVASASDIGAAIRVVVSAANSGGTTDAVSARTSRVAPVTASGFWSWQVGPYAAHTDALWDAVRGAGATPAIAVVDSGVDSSLPGLEGAVRQQVTMTSLQQSSAADGYGHGSFVASIAAGRAPGEAGAAPGAQIVSLDVMNDEGMAMTSDVIAAADWIYAHKDEYGIGVANFSLLGSTPTSIQYDPLDKALERLWLAGVVVVTAAGNYAVDGAPDAVQFAPANDPFLITVGAADVAGSVPASDDVAAPWSVYGHTPDGFGKPELGAPGRYIVQPVPTDSTLYRSRPDRIVSEGRLQLSGTSFAAPMVAGLAANLLALHPSWTPDQVKGALMISAAPTAAAPDSLGVGEVDGAAALAVTDPPNPNAALESFLVADPVGGATKVFDAASWGTAAQANASWGTASWGTASWGTASWGTASWGTTYWSAASWGTASWGTASWGTASWGTSARAVDNANADTLPGGGYWRWSR